jgi:hypothetical protein
MRDLEKVVHNKRRPDNLRLEERTIVRLTIHRGYQSLIGEATVGMNPERAASSATVASSRSAVSATLALKGGSCFASTR